MCVCMCCDLSPDYGLLSCDDIFLSLFTVCFALTFVLVQVQLYKMLLLFILVSVVDS